MPKRRTKAKSTSNASNSVPRKRTRRSTRLNTDNETVNAEKEQVLDDYNANSPPSDNGVPLEASTPHNDMVSHSESDSDDQMDWEHIEMSAPATEDMEEQEEEVMEQHQPVTYQDVEVVFEAPRAVLK